MSYETPSAAIYLKPKRVRPVERRHPWLFSGAIQRRDGDVAPGDLVSVHAPDGKQLALAYYNPNSQIRARVLTWRDEPIDRDFWRERLARAINQRSALQLGPQTNAVRLINAEADGVPGLIVDKYDDVLVMQCLTAGIDVRRAVIVELLVELLAPRAIVERSDVAVREKEGLPSRVDIVHGDLESRRVTIRESGLRFLVDPLHGHKTGFYLDQRQNRAWIGRRALVADREVLNVFAYTGGFGVYAAANGARHVTNVDTSADALHEAEANFLLNAIDPDAHAFIAADAFQLLRDYRDNGRQFDMIVLDPPKFAHTQRDVKRATRGYKDINWLALRLLRPGGILATFSCSGAISRDLFQKVLFGAATDAGRTVQIVQSLDQSADHPILLSFPESAYLKGFLCYTW